MPGGHRKESAMYSNLKLRIWQSGIRQNRLAQMLGIDEATLSRIVNGFRQPKDDIRNKIAAVLESDVRWLFEKFENTPKSDIQRGDALPAPRNT